MLFEGLENTNSTNVVTTGNHDNGVILEFDNSHHFSGGQVQLDSVVDLNVWMWEPEGSAIMSDDVWDLLLADFLFEDFAQLELGFFLVNPVGKEPSFGVNKHSEIFISLFNSNNVHLT